MIAGTESKANMTSESSTTATHSMSGVAYRALFCPANGHIVVFGFRQLGINFFLG
jgi:hypothetical protein